MPNAHRITQEMGIRLHGRKDPYPATEYLPPRHTWARKTIYDAAVAGEREGMPEHVYDVLGVFLINEANQTQMFGDAISGVSKWMLRHRITTEEVAFMKDAFAELDIKTIREAVKHYRITPRSPQIAFLVADRMEAALWSLRQ